MNDVLHKIYGGIGPRQRNHVKSAIMEAYDESHTSSAPTLADVRGPVRRRLWGTESTHRTAFCPTSWIWKCSSTMDRRPRPFEDFFDGVTVVDLAELGIGEKERNMLVVLFLNFYYEYMINLDKPSVRGDGSAVSVHRFHAAGG